MRSGFGFIIEKNKIIKKEKSSPHSSLLTSVFEQESNRNSLEIQALLRVAQVAQAAPACDLRSHRRRRNSGEKSLFSGFSGFSVFSGFLQIYLKMEFS